MAEPRTIVIVTGSRAEFGLLQPVMAAIRDHPALTLRTVATGTHLTAGSSADIEAAGFTIDARVSMQAAGETGRAADTVALARGIERLPDAWRPWAPDFVVVLGDRIEAFAAAAAASIGGQRVAHIHGGDRAEGVADEAMRHAISKLAHLHLPATGQSRRRLIRMGEPAARVHRVGSPAVDGLKDVTAADDAPRLIVMQHPIGAAEAQERAWMEGTLAATANYDRLVLAPNHDPGRPGVLAAIEAAGVACVEHLPRARFLSLLKGAGAIVGNSSAGLIEAAALKTPCVNLGPRQAGREKPGHVIDCDYGRDAVAAAVERALSLNLSRLRHPYGPGDAGPRIAETLASVDLTALPLRKQNAF